MASILSSCVLFLSLLLSSVIAQTTSCGCETTLASGFQWTGNMFDVVVDSTDAVVVEAFEQNMLLGAATGEVYYRSGTYVGNEQATDWIQVASQSVNGSGAYASSGQLAHLSLLPRPLSLTAGQTYGFAIVMLGTHLLYTVGNASYDGCLGYTITTGIGIDRAPPITFSIANRSWNGRMQTMCALTSGVGTSAVVTTGAGTTGTSAIITTGVGTTGTSAVVTTGAGTTGAGTSAVMTTGASTVVTTGAGTTGINAVGTTGTTGTSTTSGAAITSTSSVLVAATTTGVAEAAATNDDALFPWLAIVMIAAVALPFIAVITVLYLRTRGKKVHCGARPKSEEYQIADTSDVETATEESEESSSEAPPVIYHNITDVLRTEDDFVPFTDMRGKAEEAEASRSRGKSLNDE